MHKDTKHDKQQTSVIFHYAVGASQLIYIFHSELLTQRVIHANDGNGASSYNSHQLC